MSDTINENRANRFIDFMGCLHLTGDYYGQLFVVQPWQRNLLRNVYGTVKDGKRQYKTAYLEAPKKTGKTEMIAGLALAHLDNDPPGGRIYCCAAEKEQAGLVYTAACEMIKQEPEFQEAFRVVDSKKQIFNRKTGSFIKVLSAEAYSKHGVNPTVVIFDENSSPMLAIA